MPGYSRSTALYIFFGIHYHISGIISAVNLINTRQCRPTYDDKFLHQNKKISFEEAIKFCDNENGVLPTPLQGRIRQTVLQILQRNKTMQDSWQDALEYIHQYQIKNRNENKEIWIGVIYEKTSDSKMIAYDYRRRTLDNGQLSQLNINVTSALHKMNVGATQCVVYVSTMDYSKRHFYLQACNTIGVIPMANAVCVCEPGTPENNYQQDYFPNIKPNPTTTLAKNESPSVPRARAGISKLEIDKETPEQSTNTMNESSITLAVSLSLIATCCMLGAAYFVIKKRSLYTSVTIPRTGGEPALATSRIFSVSEAQTTDHRILHVYEEINLQNTRRISANEAFIGHFTESTEHDEESTTRRRNQFEDDYLQPTVCTCGVTSGNEGHMHDPDNMHAHTRYFPNLLDQKTIKYASVETIHTDLNEGETEQSEEYYVDDACDCPTIYNIDGSPRARMLPENTPLNFRPCAKNNVSTTFVTSEIYTEKNNNPYENESATISSAEIDMIDENHLKQIPTPCSENKETVIYTKVSSFDNEELYAQVNARPKKIGNSLSQFSESAIVNMEDIGFNATAFSESNTELDKLDAHDNI